MDWQKYLYGFAKHASLKSKDPTKVGAILVGKDNTVLLTAYNGNPIKVHDTEKRRERPEKYLYVSHAEQNLIAFAARKGVSTEGCDIYCTHHPCSNCAKSIIQAGIKKIYCGDELTSMPKEEFVAASEMLNEAGVVIEFL
jgi:dCMP deaminase